MQIRKSLIELEGMNLRNGVEIGRRELILQNWGRGSSITPESLNSAPQKVRSSYLEILDLRKTVQKNNLMKKSIVKRLKNNEGEAKAMREEMMKKVSGEERMALMSLQYDVGFLERFLLFLF